VAGLSAAVTPCEAFNSLYMICPNVDPVFTCLIKRGAFAHPAHDFSGCSYKPTSTHPEQEKWENIKQLW